MAKVRIRHGDNEVEVDGTDSFIAKQLKDFYERIQLGRNFSAPVALKKDIQAPAIKKPKGKRSFLGFC